MTHSLTCYMCDAKSTSKEHVPPRCLFPESKDVDGQFRINLITVPSCNKHNSGKSSDDEFLLVSLAGILGNNSIGYKQKFSKVNRAIYRSSFELLTNSMKNRKLCIYEVSSNKFIDVIWGTPDYDRLNNCFDRIARGLFYHVFDIKFSGKTKTMLGYIQHKESTPKEFQRFIRDKILRELKGKPRLGDNPEVFSFQFTDLDQYGLCSLHLEFYGGLDFYIALIPEQIKFPNNITMEMINLGIQTHIKLGDEIYRFNMHRNE
ncbi:hypothetical protein [Gimesia aquarii]|uniref:HNH endonuclease 5 domain-containing protein n=1 Tax=Gimesia aquarii TaxID=2527964 RepID=A0A517VQZ4_9PLAN|nr:hypothetical protein [Gimesia aquarii]QDT95369.1 hypothetical protein V144x_08110 [Gimesia aquarii]